MANRFLNRVNTSTLLVLLLLAAPFNLFLFPARTRQLQLLSGEANPIIDTWFAYSPDRLFHMLSAFGPQGRLIYAASELTIDLIYPVLYTLILWVMMALIFRVAFPSWTGLPALARLPLFAFLSDYLENFTLVSLILIDPRRPYALGWLASVFTTLKFALVVLCLLLILFGTLVFLRRAIFPA